MIEFPTWDGLVKGHTGFRAGELVNIAASNIHRRTGKSRFFAEVLEDNQKVAIVSKEIDKIWWDELEDYCRADTMFTRHWRWTGLDPTQYLSKIVEKLLDVGCDPQYNLTINYYLGETK